MVPKVKLERIQRGLRQVDVVALTKGAIPQHRLSLLERGVQPRPNETKILTKIFGLLPEDLFETGSHN